MISFLSGSPAILWNSRATARGKEAGAATSNSLVSKTLFWVGGTRSWRPSLAETALARQNSAENRWLSSHALGDLRGLPSPPIAVKVDCSSSWRIWGSGLARMHMPETKARAGFFSGNSFSFFVADGAASSGAEVELLVHEQRPLELAKAGRALSPYSRQDDQLVLRKYNRQCYKTREMGLASTGEPMSAEFSLSPTPARSCPPRRTSPSSRDQPRAATPESKTPPASSERGARAQVELPITRASTAHFPSSPRWSSATKASKYSASGHESGASQPRCADLPRRNTLIPRTTASSRDPLCPAKAQRA